MKRIFLAIAILILIAFSTGCYGTKEIPIPGAEQFELYEQLIEGKSVAVVANQTSMVGNTHLVNFLLNSGINIKVIFAPEHGFREFADEGDEIKDGKGKLYQLLN